VPVFHGRALSPDFLTPDNILFAWPDEPVPADRSGRA
jgi:hypothetical protein